MIGEHGLQCLELDGHGVLSTDEVGSRAGFGTPRGDAGGRPRTPPPHRRATGWPGPRGATPDAPAARPGGSGATASERQLQLRGAEGPGVPVGAEDRGVGVLGRDRVLKERAPEDTWPRLEPARRQDAHQQRGQGPDETATVHAGRTSAPGTCRYVQPYTLCSSTYTS